VRLQEKNLVITGLLFFVIGIVGLVHPELTYHKIEEVAHVGPVRATVNKDGTATVPRAVSVILLAVRFGARAATTGQVSGCRFSCDSTSRNLQCF